MCGRYTLTIDKKTIEKALRWPLLHRASLVRLDSDVQRRPVANDAHHPHAPSREGSSVVTFAILTTTANEIMQPIHERMPVILPLGREKDWLPPSHGMLIFPPFPSELMTAYPVSPKMNKASFNEPEAIWPLEPEIR